MLVVSVISLLLALDPNSSVLALVGFAWAGFGAAFGPIVLLSLFWRRLTMAGAAVGMVAGAVVSFVWGQSWGAEDQPLDVILGLFGEEHLYEIIPGFLVCLVLAVLISLVTPQPAKAMEEFDDVLDSLATGEAPDRSRRALRGLSPRRPAAGRPGFRPPSPARPSVLPGAPGPGLPRWARRAAGAGPSGRWASRRASRWAGEAAPVSRRVGRRDRRRGSLRPATPAAPRTANRPPGPRRPPGSRGWW